ncbi:MAG: hypothetical protein HQL95_09995 [Magnetococcales bacterium]|nr:hypothetical protein [Magnetococcales bacterium]
MTRLTLEYGQQYALRLYQNARERVADTLDSRPMVEAVIQASRVSSRAYMVDISQAARQMAQRNTTGLA